MIRFKAVVAFHFTFDTKFSLTKVAHVMNNV